MVLMGVAPAGLGLGASKVMEKSVAKRSIDVNQIEVRLCASWCMLGDCVLFEYASIGQGLALLLYMKVGPTNAASA